MMGWGWCLEVIKGLQYLIPVLSRLSRFHNTFIRLDFCSNLSILINQVLHYIY